MKNIDKAQSIFPLKVQYGYRSKPSLFKKDYLQ